MATRFITVSIEIMHDKNLSVPQKFILAEIEQLTSLDNGCIASNQHFSDLIGISKVTVSRAINDLEKQGYISIEIENGSRNHIRKISLIKMINPVLSKRSETKGNKTSNARNQDLEAFETLWKDYTLTFLKRFNRGGGSKQKAKTKYLTLVGKYTEDEIYNFVERHSSLEIGHKDLERLLSLDNIKQFFEDVA